MGYISKLSLRSVQCISVPLSTRMTKVLSSNCLTVSKVSVQRRILRKKTTPRLKLANRWISKCLSSLKTTEELCCRTRRCGQQKKTSSSSSCARKKPAPTKGSSIQSINQQTEKSTLGDLEALSALKEKMSGGGGEPKAE